MPKYDFALFDMMHILFAVMCVFSAFLFSTVVYVISASGKSEHGNTWNLLDIINVIKVKKTFTVNCRLIRDDDIHSPNCWICHRFCF